MRGDGNDTVQDINVAFNVTIGTLASPGSQFRFDGGAGFDILLADFGFVTQPVIWSSASPTNNEFADGSYFRNFEQLTWFVSGTGNDSITQLGRLNNDFALLGGNDTLNPGLGIDRVFAGAGDDLLVLDYSQGDDANVSAILIEGSDLVRRDINTNAVIDRVQHSGFERFQITGSSKADNLSRRRDRQRHYSGWRRQ
jgi:hypothetical protein